VVLSAHDSWRIAEFASCNEILPAEMVAILALGMTNEETGCLVAWPASVERADADAAEMRRQRC